MELDRAEKTILKELQQEGRLTNVELAERIGLSEAPCYRRVRALEKQGIITGYSARLDRRALGFQVTAFVLVTLDQQTDSKLHRFLDAVEAEPHIVECHAMSGNSDYLLKVIARSMEHFSDLSMKQILRFPGVKNIESNFSLLAAKESSPVPVENL